MDAIAEWVRAQGRVIELVGSLSAARAAVTVPACPDWTVRDLLSHMVGLDADVLDGDEPDDHNDDWTWASRGPVAAADVVVRASDFDLTRALMSRRSAAQLRAWTERGSIDPFLPKFELLGPLPDEDLTETF